MKTLIAVLVLFFTVAFFNTVLGQTTYIDTAIQNATPAGVEHNQFYKEYLYAMTPTPPSGILVYAVPTIASQATVAVGYVNAVRPPAVTSRVSLERCRSFGNRAASRSKPLLLKSLNMPSIDFSFRPNKARTSRIGKYLTLLDPLFSLKRSFSKEKFNEKYQKI